MKTDHKSLLFQLTDKNLIVSDFREGSIKQKVNALPNLASHIDKQFMRFFNIEHETNINFVCFNSLTSILYSVQCNRVSLECKVIKSQELDTKPSKIISNSDGSLYMVVVNNGLTKAKKVNDNLIWDPKEVLRVNSHYKMVNKFKQVWIGYNNKSIVKMTEGYDKKSKVKTLEYQTTLITTDNVLYSHTTENYFFARYENTTSKYPQKILIGVVFDGKMRFYTMISINGVIMDAFEWDNFLVLFSSKNILLFKPPNDNRKGVAYS